MVTAIVYFTFAASVLVAVVGNLIVYIKVTRSGIPVRFMWAGTPGYLYRAALRANPTVAALVRPIAFASNLGLLLAFVLGFALMFT